MTFSKKLFSLSKAQKRIWYKVRLQENERGIGLVYALRGHLIVERLEKALFELVEDHRIFKSVIYQDGHRLERVVKKEIIGELQYIDALNSDQIKNISVTIEQLLQTDLNLMQGPLFRFYLVCENEDLHQLVLIVHPIIISRGALRTFVKQISHYYNKQFVNYNNKETTSDLVMFEDILSQEEAYLKTDAYRDGLLHWVNTLKANEFYFGLPIKKSFKEMYYENNRIDFSLNRNENKLFYNYLSSQKVSAYAVLMAVYQSLLFRYSQKEDIIVSYSFPNTYSDSQASLGCVDNKVHCRTFFTGNERFTDLVRDLSFRLDCDGFYKSVPLTDIVRMVRDKFSKK